MAEAGGGGGAYDDRIIRARLAQAFGRLIRSRSDRGILAILDSRLRTRGYGRLFLESLPDYAVVDTVDGLRDFLVEAGSAGRSDSTASSEDTPPASP